jgi:hypothetical protein
MSKNKDFNPQFVVTWFQLQGYYQVETPFPKYNPGSIMSNSEDEIMKKLYEWLHLNDKLSHGKPTNLPAAPKHVAPSDYLKEMKKSNKLLGRCVRCGQVDEMVLFIEEDKLCYCANCVPCL